MNFFQKGRLYVPDYNQVMKALIPAPMLEKVTDDYLRIPRYDKIPVPSLWEQDDLPTSSPVFAITFKRHAIYFVDASQTKHRIDCWHCLED